MVNKNNDNKRRELINNSTTANVNNILNTESTEQSETNILSDNCLNHNKFINIFAIHLNYNYQFILKIKTNALLLLLLILII